MGKSLDKTEKKSLNSQTDLSGLFQTLKDKEYDTGSVPSDILEERERFQMFTDSIPFGIALVNKNGFHTYLNPKFRQMFGYDLVEIPDRETWFEKAYPEESYRSYVRSRWQSNYQFYKSEETKPSILNITCKDGSVKSIRLSSVQLKTGEILLVYEDFTELLAAREARKKSENRLRLLYEKSVDPIFIFDGHRYLDCNEAAVKIMHAADKEQLLKYGPLDISPEKQPDGELSSEKLKLVLLKLTEARKAVAELQFTQFAVDRAAVGIIWIKEDARILYANNETCRSLGYLRKELLNMTIHEINPEYKKETWEKVWHDVKRLGSITIETLYKGKDEIIFPVELTGNYMEYDGEGYICAIVRDITERKKTEDSLKRREEELQIESNRLEEANTALKVLLKHREDDKKEMEEKFLSNIKELVFPYVDKLKKSRLDSNQTAYIDIIEANMNDIISPFLQRMSLKYSNFTQTEIQVANLIKVGKTTKEIAELMNVSKGTVDTHRNNIRSKLGLNRKKINLRAYLLSIA